MKRIIARLYITIITVMILFGLIFLINEIRVSRNEYINESVKVSDQTKELIEENWFKNKNFENQNLSESLKDFMNEHKNIHSIIIYSKDKGLTKFNSRYNDRAFLLNSLIPNDPSWNIRPEYSFNWWDKYNNNITSTPLQIDDRGFAFDLIYNVLSTEKVEKVFKDAFIIILIFLILTIIVIIIFSVWKSKNSISEYDGKDEPPFTGVPLDGKESMGSLEDIGEPQSFSDLDMDFDDEMQTSDDSLDDLDMDFEDDDHTSDDDSSDDLEDLDDFNIGSEDDLDEVSELDELDDFDMDFSDTSDNDESDTLDDFDMDFGDDDDDTSGDELDDFDLDFEDKEPEPDDTTEELDDFDLDFEDDASELDDTPEDLDDFDLDFEDNVSEPDDTTDDLDDFDLDFEDNTSETEDTTDDLDDFDLDFEDNASEPDDITDDLDDFDLDTDDSSELDDLDAFDLDTEDSSDIDDLDDLDLDIDDATDIDDLDDLDLDIEDATDIDDLDDLDLDIEDTTDIGDLNDLDLDIEDDVEDLGDLTESLDDENKTTYDLDDFALDSDENTDGYDLEDFSLDSNDINMDDNETSEVKFKESSEIGPDLSSMLEKAGVAETDLSVIVVNIKDGNTRKQHDFLSQQFGEDSNVYQLNDKQIVVTLNETEIDDAVTKIDEVLFNAEQNDLAMSIGVSSMSGRRVGENRLLGEAIQAVQKAEESSKHMLAFRPDPAKYKDYIKNS